ncbi:uncharacterized protein TNCV_4809051 [Trichonephila clavipes]|nr:uncharacterized protein TNCV_4809051 [Trichonephila clavipes]
MERREPEEEKEERGHRVTCVISVKKLDNCRRFRLVNFPTFQLGVLFPRPRNIISGLISCSVRNKGWEYAIETLMTAHINTDFVNHPEPSTTEPSTNLERVGNDACESIINSILRYRLRFPQKCVAMRA